MGGQAVTTKTYMRENLVTTRIETNLSRYRHSINSVALISRARKLLAACTCMPLTTLCVDPRLFCVLYILSVCAHTKKPRPACTNFTVEDGAACKHEKSLLCLGSRPCPNNQKRHALPPQLNNCAHTQIHMKMSNSTVQLKKLNIFLH